ncbi:MAG: hypothetical protein WC392_02840 [Sulfuricella sp.]|jgi:hypothetical protein
MKQQRFALALALSFAALPVLAQNFITEISGSTYREKTVYAVYDLRGSNLNVEAIETAVLDAIKLYARNARAQQGIPPSSYPAYPAQMTMGQSQSGGPKPDCAGEIFSIEGVDSSMAKYGETTYHRACLFPYANGYRLNYFAIFGMQSGVGNPNPNVLAAMLGRTMAGAVGLGNGNSSNFINKILDRIEGNLKRNGYEAKLVQLHPKAMEGRVVMQDDLSPPPIAATPSPALQQQPISGNSTPSRGAPVTAGIGGAQQNLPPELVQLREVMMRQSEAARRQMGIADQPVIGGQSGVRGLTPTDARKELTAMGLQYFSQEQFVAAIQRGDTLAVELFVAGTGVDINAGEPGKTPLAVADSAGRQEIAALLRGRGAR